MKKLDLKRILKKFNWVDIIIILCVIGAIAFAFTQIGADDNKEESVSFDSSTLNKLVEKYQSFYREGKIIKSHVGGYNSSSGEYQELYGTVLWADDYKGSNVKILIEVDGELVLAGLYKDVKDADIYIEHITLETSGEKYPNLTEIQINSKNISNLKELSEGIPNGTNYTITTTIAIDTKNSQIYQELSNELLFNGKRQSVKTLSDEIQDQLAIVIAQSKELDIASEILGDLNGNTDLITIRIYNSTENHIKAIEEAYDVINIRKIT